MTPTPFKSPVQSPVAATEPTVSYNKDKVGTRLANIADRASKMAGNVRDNIRGGLSMTGASLGETLGRIATPITDGLTTVGNTVDTLGGNIRNVITSGLALAQIQNAVHEQHASAANGSKVFCQAGYVWDPVSQSCVIDPTDMNWGLYVWTDDVTGEKHGCFCHNAADPFDLNQKPCPNCYPAVIQDGLSHDACVALQDYTNSQGGCFTGGGVICPPGQHHDPVTGLCVQDSPPNGGTGNGGGTIDGNKCCSTIDWYGFLNTPFGGWPPDLLSYLQNHGWTVTPNTAAAIGPVPNDPTPPWMADGLGSISWKCKNAAGDVIANGSTFGCIPGVTQCFGPPQLCSGGGTGGPPTKCCKLTDITTPKELCDWFAEIKRRCGDLFKFPAKITTEDLPGYFAEDETDTFNSDLQDWLGDFGNDLDGADNMMDYLALVLTSEADLQTDGIPDSGTW